MGNARMHMRELRDLRVFIAGIFAYRAFLVPDAGRVFRGGRIYYPFKAMGSRCAVDHLTAAVVDAELPVIVPVGVPAFFGDMGERGNDKLFCANLGFGFVKQLMADRAFVVGLFARCAALGRHFGDQVAVFMLGTGDLHRSDCRASLGRIIAITVYQLRCYGNVKFAR